MKPFEIIEDDQPQGAAKTAKHPFEACDLSDEPPEKPPSEAITIETINITPEEEVPMDAPRPISAFNVLVLGVLAFIIFAVLAQTLETIQTMATSTNVADAVYLFGLAALLGAIGFTTSRAFSEVRHLQQAEAMQAAFKQQREQADHRIIALSETLLAHYEAKGDEELAAAVKSLRCTIVDTGVYETIYDDVEQQLLQILDARAERIVQKISMQTALSTAISPAPVIDMILIVWRSAAMTKEIATLYGFKPGFLTTIMLLRRGAFNLAFAGLSELAVDYSSEVLGASLIGKLSTQTAQGMANGILTVRLGRGIIKACRPMKPSETQSSVDSFSKMFLKRVLKPEQA